MKNKSIKKILSSLKSTPKILKDFIKSIDADELDRKRGEDVWTLREHLYHLVKVQPMLYKRLELFRDQENPEIVPYIPKDDQAGEDDAPQSIGEALKNFMQWRKKQVKLVKSFKQNIFEKKGSHNQYTHYDFPILLRHILMHDYWHMYRMEDVWLCKDEYFK